MRSITGNSYFWRTAETSQTETLKNPASGSFSGSSRCSIKCPKSFAGQIPAHAIVLKWQILGSQVHGFLLSVFSFASAAAISSQDGALQACHGGPARITLPSALHLGTPYRAESAPAKVSSSWRVPTSQSLTA